MSEGALRPANVAAAAVFIGGVLMVAMPRHALSILQVVVVTAAVSVGVYALAVHVPTTGWISPFKWLSPFSRSAHPEKPGHRSRQLGLIRSQMADRRQRIEGGPPLPPAILRELRLLVAGALDIDLQDEAGRSRARGAVSDLSFAVLNSRPLERPTWLRTLRPDPAQTARVVNRVLDDIERVLGQESPPQTSADFSHGSAP